jgi:ATP-binding cassette subfamily C (CFTR/MRP) protein 4
VLYNTVDIFHYIWIAPTQLIIVVCLTWLQIGYSTLGGFFIILFFVPLQSQFNQSIAMMELHTFQSSLQFYISVLFGNIFGKLRHSTASKTDDRIRIMNELIRGIRGAIHQLLSIILNLDS